MNIAIARVSELHNTALYFERAAKAAGHKVTVLHTIDAVTASQRFDLFLAVDPWLDGLEYLPDFACPTAVVLIDVHRDLRVRKIFSVFFDHVFVAQRDLVTDIAAAGHPSVHWLPLGGDPAIHFVPNRTRDIEVGFVGKLGIPGTDRHAVLSEIISRFRTNEIARYYTPSEMGDVYSRCKIVFNKSIGGDVNMRLFEALASGALLVTDRIGNGFDRLATEGVHYVGYDTVVEAVAQIERYLKDASARVRIAEAGQALCMERHTYAVRLQDIMKTVLARPETAAPARQATPRERRLWRAEWARYRGASPRQALALISEGLTFAGLTHIAIGLARAAKKELVGKMGT